jgi:hypothetical protein
MGIKMMIWIPISQLKTIYRCNSTNLELFNEVVYAKSLALGPHNDDFERVGSAWDVLTGSRYYVKEQSLAGVRRMFISVPGLAEKTEGETSWVNHAIPCEPFTASELRQATKCKGKLSR